MSMQPRARDVRSMKASKPLRMFSTPAFATYIDGFQLPDPDGLNERLIKDILAWRDEGEDGIKSSNNRGWHSQRELYNRPEESFRELTAHLASAATECIRRYWAEFDPSRHGTLWEGWANVNGPGAMNAPHSHSHHLSGVYYVQVPEAEGPNDGMIEFLNPAGALTRSNSFDHRLIHSATRLRPRAGQVFIFPAYLKHWVYPHYSEEDRISIAFNVALAGQRISE